MNVCFTILYSIALTINPIPMTASWYGMESCTNPQCLTANGTVFDETKVTCASRTYYGKIIKIVYNDREIDCPVIDKIAKRYDATRVDISKAGFVQIAPLSKGLINVSIIP